MQQRANYIAKARKEGLRLFKILVFIPVYVLLYLVSFLQKSFSLDFSTNYFFYLRIFCIEHLNEGAYMSLLAVVVLLTGILLGIKMRKDELG